MSKKNSMKHITLKRDASSAISRMVIQTNAETNNAARINVLKECRAINRKTGRGIAWQ